MKKIITVLVIALCMILIVSCGQDVENEISRLDELKLQYDQVGRQHNLQLDRMLSIYRSQSDRQSRELCEKNGRRVYRKFRECRKKYHGYYGYIKSFV